MKRLAPFLIAIIAVTSLAGCTKKDARTDEVRGYLRATRASMSSFTYESATPRDVLANKPGSEVSVRGLLEDDFRFKARVDIDESPGYEEVVVDDAFAVRFLEPRFMNQFVNKSQIGKVETGTSVDGLNVLEALRTRRWVLDPVGAPPVVRGVFNVDDVGEDPVFDAITALDYVESALKEAAGVSLWSADSINPTYIPEEDSFPEPEEGSDTKRFDLVRPALPAASNTSGDVALPSTRHFRRMAIYVRDGKIIRVMEEVDLRSKRLREFPRYFRALLKESEAPPEVIDELTQTIEEMTEEQQQVGLLQLLNVGLRQFGQDPIFLRSMTLDFGDSEQGAEVVLPTDVVQASLALLTLSSTGAPEEGSGSETAPTDGPAGASGDGADGGGGEPAPADVPDASPEPGGVDATEPIPSG